MSAVTVKSKTKYTYETKLEGTIQIMTKQEEQHMPMQLAPHLVLQSQAQLARQVHSIQTLNCSQQAVNSHIEQQQRRPYQPASALMTGGQCFNSKEDKEKSELKILTAVFGSHYEESQIYQAYHSCSQDMDKTYTKLFAAGFQKHTQSVANVPSTISELHQRKRKRADLEDQSMSGSQSMVSTPTKSQAQVNLISEEEERVKASSNLKVHIAETLISELLKCKSEEHGKILINQAFNYYDDQKKSTKELEWENEVLKKGVRVLAKYQQETVDSANERLRLAQQKEIESNKRLAESQRLDTESKKRNQQFVDMQRQLQQIATELISVRRQNQMLLNEQIRPPSYGDSYGGYGGGPSFV